MRLCAVAVLRAPTFADTCMHKQFIHVLKSTIKLAIYTCTEGNNSLKYGNGVGFPLRVCSVIGICIPFSYFNQILPLIQVCTAGSGFHFALLVHIDVILLLG